MIVYVPWELEIQLPRGAARIEKVIVVYRDIRNSEVYYAQAPLVRAAPGNYHPQPIKE